LLSFICFYVRLFASISSVLTRSGRPRVRMSVVITALGRRR
jgi:hypothetical protein